jgi:hypothetical protein
LDRDQNIADEVYRAMSGLKICSRCKKEFKPIASEDICCMLPMEVAAMAMAHAIKRAGVSSVQAARAFEGVSKAMSKITINKED